MKIDKAAGVLQDMLDLVPREILSEQAKAVKLGIEALKQLDSCRLCCDFANRGLLPGETKD